MENQVSDKAESSIYLACCSKVEAQRKADAIIAMYLGADAFRPSEEDKGEELDLFGDILLVESLIPSDLSSHRLGRCVT